MKNEGMAEAREMKHIIIIITKAARAYSHKAWTKIRSATLVGIYLSIEFGIVTEYTLFAERQPAVTVEISSNARTLRDDSMQSRYAWNTCKNLRHRSRKSIEETFDNLEQRQVGIADRFPHEIPVAFRIAGQDVLEPAQKFWSSLLTEMSGSTQRFRFLFLIVKIGAQRMMRIVDFPDEVGDGELDLVDPEPLCLVFGGQSVTVA